MDLHVSAIAMLHRRIERLECVFPAKGNPDTIYQLQYENIEDRLCQESGRKSWGTESDFSNFCEKIRDFVRHLVDVLGGDSRVAPDQEYFDCGLAEVGISARKFHLIDVDKWCIVLNDIAVRPVAFRKKIFQMVLATILSEIESKTDKFYFMIHSCGPASRAAARKINAKIGESASDDQIFFGFSNEDEVERVDVVLRDPCLFFAKCCERDASGRWIPAGFKFSDITESAAEKEFENQCDQLLREVVTDKSTAEVVASIDTIKDRLPKLPGKSCCSLKYLEKLIEAKGQPRTIETTISRARRYLAIAEEISSESNSLKRKHPD